MTPQEALAFLDQLVSQVNLNRQMTLKALEAVQVLQALVNGLSQQVPRIVRPQENT